MINEENVVQQVKKRNEKALSYIIDQYGGLIKSIMQKYLYDLESVQDECMDDILLAIWDHIHSFSAEKNSFKNWLAAVSKYKAIDYRRKHAKFLEKQSLDPMLLDHVQRQQTDEEISTQSEEWLNHLKAEDKALFIKHYVEDQPIEELAKEMGVKTSVIYNRLSRGRKKIRTLFSEHKTQFKND